MDKDLKNIISELIEISKNSLLITFRFFETAIGLMNIKEVSNLECVCTDTQNIYYDYKFIASKIQEGESIDKLLMHILMHLILGHAYNTDEKDERIWNLACDISAESILVETKLEYYSERDNKILFEIEELKRKNVDLSAEKIYKYLFRSFITDVELLRLENLFKRDEHYLWYVENINNDFQKKDRSIKASIRESLIEESRNNYNESSRRRWLSVFNQLKARSCEINNSESELNLFQKILKAEKDKIDYGDFLKKFADETEQIGINEDEFDYVYYNHGINLYGNVPLIEPLEYKDDNKIKDFVIVLDTSGSCTGEVVQGFVNKTFSILSNQAYFSNEVNIHLIQNDTQIRSVNLIKSIEDFEKFIENEKLIGFGGTDFRPAFRKIDNLIENKEIINLKGVLYFTDGYGVYPEKAKKYKVAFVFLDNGLEIPQTPEWAMRIVIGEEEWREEVN